MTHSGGSAAPIWAMLGWYKPTGSFSLSAGQFMPVGVHEAESAGNIITWTVQSDATYRGGSGLKGSGAGGGVANFTLVEALAADDWSDTASVDVWARVQLASTLVTPKIWAWLLTSGGVNLYAEPYGVGGKLLSVPSTGTAFRFIHLGSLPLSTAIGNTLRVQLATAAGSSGTFGLDYLVTVPSAARALGPTGKPNDASYPDFLRGTTSTVKTVFANLSATLGSPLAFDTGLGGSPIEMDPGTNTLVIKYSSLVPDDPTVDATTEQLSHALTACSLFVWPRYYLARGA
jgi:hypothetical protein